MVSDDYFCDVYFNWMAIKFCNNKSGLSLHSSQQISIWKCQVLRRDSGKMLCFEVWHILLLTVKILSTFSCSFFMHSVLSFNGFPYCSSIFLCIVPAISRICFSVTCHLYNLRRFELFDTNWAKLFLFHYFSDFSEASKFNEEKINFSKRKKKFFTFKLF